jgi:hypothetical protein
MSDEESRVTARVELVFNPDLDFVGKVRQFVGELTSNSRATGDWTAQIEIAVHEMLENAVKSASIGLVKVSMRLLEGPGGLEVELRTENRAKDGDLRALEVSVSRAQAAADPFAYYLELMRATVGKESSGLGLGRIRAEAGMSVFCEVVGDRACVIARGTMGEA